MAKRPTEGSRTQAVYSYRRMPFDNELFARIIRLIVSRLVIRRNDAFLLNENIPIENELFIVHVMLMY